MKLLKLVPSARIDLVRSPSVHYVSLRQASSVYWRPIRFALEWGCCGEMKVVESNFARNMADLQSQELRRASDTMHPLRAAPAQDRNAQENCDQMIHESQVGAAEQRESVCV